MLDTVSAKRSGSSTGGKHNVSKHTWAWADIWEPSTNTVLITNLGLGSLAAADSIA